MSCVIVAPTARDSTFSSLLRWDIDASPLWIWKVVRSPCQTSQVFSCHGAGHVGVPDHPPGGRPIRHGHVRDLLVVLRRPRDIAVQHQSSRSRENCTFAPRRVHECRADGGRTSRRVAAAPAVAGKCTRRFADYRTIVLALLRCKGILRGARIISLVIFVAAKRSHESCPSYQELLSREQAWRAFLHDTQVSCGERL